MTGAEQEQGASYAEFFTGAAGGEGHLADVLGHLRTTFDEYWEELATLRRGDFPRLSLLGPYLTRTILELSTTSALARLDPFRVLLIRKIQLGDYDLGKRSKVAIQWTGDVLKKDSAAVTWSADNELAKYSRALLDDCWAEFAWSSASRNLIDSISDAHQGAWFSYLRGTDPDALITRVRQGLVRSYSSLSKGVHHEFVIDRSVRFDEPTVKSLISEVVRDCAILSLLVHFVEYAAYPVEQGAALDCFSALQASEEQE